MAEKTDWSRLDSVRGEWPASDLDPDRDLAAWRSGRRVYDANNDYRSMMQAGDLMCQALRHSLYGPGILAGGDLPDTVHSVLWASLCKPPDGRTLTEQAMRQIRLGLTIMKKHGWQPVRMGGDGTLDEPFFQAGNYFLIGAAIGPGGLPGGVDSFFTSNPISIPDPAAPAGRPARPGSADDPVIKSLNQVIADADAGDAASQVYRKGLAAAFEGDAQTALGYYEEAAQLGLVDAMYDAGCVNGDLGRTSASTYWWEAAARNGHGKAAYNLGIAAFQAGDLGAAQHWCQRAAELGESGGCAALTQMAAEAGDDRAEMYWSRQGAELGHPFCLMRYGQLLVQANPEDRAVVQRALALEERAAEMGEAGAMFLAGTMNGQLGYRSEARRWLEQAERAGHPRARSVIDRYGL